ncbi:MAG TPA: TonB-dependent receptor plug domain-containing protein [Hyphomonadaceae bacterium]|jgi:outer membrane receptor protein involved in Fe transport|nr:TonB-dependent receptor plug domain-containing protein [Hyphomonadaceae bacterium]
MAIKKLRGASALALLIGTSATAAFAQQAPQTTTTSQPATPAPQAAAPPDRTTASQEATEGNKVTVTGSLTATAPEDAPKPVEVYTMDDLQQQGTPNVTEFIRSLSISYGDDLGFGQASPDVPEGTGFGNANLRGLGSNATLALMNGKPVAPWNGSFGADINTVPMDALAAVEVLKGGASATYGAGAVAGVLNFKTRRDVDSPQITIEKQIYDGSDGYYKVNFMTGWVGDAANLLLSATHTHEDEMLQTARDFSSAPFALTPSAYTLTGSNPGQFQIVTQNFQAATGNVTQTTTPTGRGYVGPLTASAVVNDYRTATDCTDLGGQITSVRRPGDTSTACGFAQAPFQSLVNENTQDQVFAEFNADLSDSMEFNFNVNYSRSDTYEARVPIDGATVQAIDRNTTVAGVRNGIANCAGCNYVVPVRVQTYSPAIQALGVINPTGTPTGNFVRNPFIDDFMSRTGQTATTLPEDAALYMGSTGWRPFLFGGNPMFEDGLRRNEFERDSIAITSGIKGEFTEDSWIGPWLNGIKYEMSGQFNQYLNTYHQGDLFSSRLQNGLLGYGGPNCNAVDRVPTDYSSAAAYNRTVGIQSNTAPGTGGCQWFNPFASNFRSSVVNGAANPQSGDGRNVALALAPGSTPRPTGWENPRELIDWMWGDKVAEFQLQSGTFDGQLSGTVPDTIFALPGGEIGWGAGFQWRQVEGRRMNVEDNEAEESMNVQNCVWPDRAVVSQPAQQEPGRGQIGCTTVGAFYGTGQLTIVGNTVPPWYYDNQNIAVFGQVDLPLLENLNVQYNMRHEEWNGGDLKGDIWSIAGKYDVTDNLWVRATYGTNYRADAALELDPGSTIFNAVTQARFGVGRLVNEATTVSSNIAPEDDKTFDFGIGWESDLGEGKIRASLGFFEVLIDGAVATTSNTTVYNNVFGQNTATGMFDPDGPCPAGGTVATAGCQFNPSVGSAAGTVTGTAVPLDTFQYANCDASLVSFVTFTTACSSIVVGGQTVRYNNSNNLFSLDRFQQNGPGFITNGLDYSIDVAYPLFDGTFTAQVTATQNLVYKAHGYSVNGIVFEAGGNRLGQANYTNTPANESRRWRANGQLRWANDTHNISVRANYSSGVYNEAAAVGGLTAIQQNPTVNSTYGVLPKSYLDFDVNYIYTAPFWQDLELRATVLNIFDKDPTGAQARNGYYTATGNPRGRIIELGVTKKF